MYKYEKIINENLTDDIRVILKRIYLTQGYHKAWKMVNSLIPSSCQFSVKYNYEFTNQGDFIKQTISRNSNNNLIRMSYYGKEMPLNKPGLYLVGQSFICPVTNAEYYWIKIGKSNNVAQRIRGYATDTPMLYKIAFLYDCQNIDNTEILYQNKLINIAEGMADCSNEWFLVDKLVYMEICKKGFEYFNMK